MRRDERKAGTMRTIRATVVMACLLAACGSETKDAPRPVVGSVQTTLRVVVTTTPATTTSTAAPATTQATVPATTPATAPATTRATTPAASAVFYPNCAAVRAAGAAPIRRGDPGYSSSLDRDGDGIACET